MKPLDLKSNTYINFSKETNDKVLKFKNGDIVRISKCKNILANSYFPDWCEDVFWLKKLKTLFCGQMLLVILKVKQFFERFTKNNCKKQIKKRLELKK